MSFLDWSIVALFMICSIAIGMSFSRKAGKSLESYFASDRKLGWWLAGTSIAATAFSSDTPLLVTGMIRRRGIWGTWELLALGISTMFAVFVFARLWKRTGVLTEVEFVELRYSGKSAAILRGFKSIYWGLFYNCFVMGAWPVIGLAKVLQETAGIERNFAIILCVAIGTLYTSFSGLWGVVLTDAFQFIWAMIGCVILAIWSVNAAGGIDAIVDKLHSTSYLAVIPPADFSSPGALIESPFGWFLGLMLIQWWAWKNSDGGGIIVQRLVSCRNEKQAMGSVLWFSIAHYCLRAWPWIVAAIASIILIPNDLLISIQNGTSFIDHEMAYPKLITMLLPSGLRGVMVAAFLAAFLSTISTHLNWGSSYLINDFYKRFFKKDASQKHYVLISRLIPPGLALGAMLVAFQMRSIGQSFTLILNLTAGIGPVYLLRWFWWRINPWSEIAAMTASLPAILIRPYMISLLGLPQGLLVELFFMVVACAFIWIPATLITKPAEKTTLEHFYSKVSPPGFWGIISKKNKTKNTGWGYALLQWVVATIALIASAIGPINMIFRDNSGWMLCVIAILGWLLVGYLMIRQDKSKPFA